MRVTMKKNNPKINEFLAEILRKKIEETKQIVKTLKFMNGIEAERSSEHDE